MSINKRKAAQTNHPFIGTWHIYEMSEWDEDFFNMETQAYVEIQKNNLGSFQFGLYQFEQRMHACQAAQSPY